MRKETWGKLAVGLPVMEIRRVYGRRYDLRLGKHEF